MLFSIVVAKSDNDVIGLDNTLPWHLPEDLKRFKQVTMGHPMIMGRLTYGSIGKPLPGRKTIVVSTQSLSLPAEVIVAGNLDEAVNQAAEQAQAMGVEEIMVVGGAKIYEQFLPKVNRLYVTEVHTLIEGDAFFPRIEAIDWKETERVAYPAKTQENLAFSFVTYERVADG